MKKYIVTEGKFDRLLLEKLLSDNSNSILEFVESNGFSAAISTAVTLLSSNKGKVIFIADADTNDEKLIREKLGQIKFLLNHASPSHNYEIVLIAPEIETLFFQDEDVAKVIAKRELNDFEIKLAAASPREALKLYRNFDAKKKISLIEELTSDIVYKMRQLPKVREIIAIV